VRSLAESLGARLGCGGTVLTLRRDSVAGFDVKDAMTLDDLKGMSAAALTQRIESGMTLLLAAAQASSA
jgi:tRNA U55 pseudouridine synthase TruB